MLTISPPPCRSHVAVLAFLLTLASLSSGAQSTDESLGPLDSHGKVKGTPLLEEMRTLHSSLRPDLTYVHPRVYFTAAELETLRTRLHSPAETPVWEDELARLRVLSGDPPPPPADKRRAQNDVAFAIAEGAFAAQMESANPALHRQIVAATKRYMDAAVSYDIWGYSSSKPNTDLAAGHLLYGMGVAYDLLFHDLTPADRDRYRACIARHGDLLYQAFAPQPGRAYAYSQNHTFIPMAGLAVAAYAVYGEVPNAANWAALARAIYSRVLATYSPDGFYYEGYEYWIFATPWIIHYLDAQRHATGEDLFDQPGLHLTHLYAAHALLPGGQSIFDFGDVFEGPITRAGEGEDYERSHPGDHFESNFNLLYDLAARFHSPEIQGVADWMKTLGHTAQEPWWTLVWRDNSLSSQPIDKLPSFHHFTDHDVVFWRTSWDAGATAIAFKCGPPEGHHITAALTTFPDFHLEEGHVHPDVASFILFAHGQYLTGDSGYSGVPKSADHNTLLVDARGQGIEGGHDAWKNPDYTLLNQIHLNSVVLKPDAFDVTGEGANAYSPALGLDRFTRRIQLTRPNQLTVTDTIHASQPHAFSEFLHTDTTFSTLPNGDHKTQVGTSTLLVKAQSTPATTSSIEPNVVMGPGPPGAVDKGTAEARGERLLFVTRQSTQAFTFIWVLTF